MKVMIVQGDKLQAEMYKDAYEMEGNQVVVASGAQDAITKLDKGGVDLILLDLILPGRSGVEVLHELNSYDDWQEIPVALITDNHPKTFKISESDMGRYSVKQLFFKQNTTPKQVAQKSKQLVA